jgi:hypothetical protein
MAILFLKAGGILQVVYAPERKTATAVELVDYRVGWWV